MRYAVIIGMLLIAIPLVLRADTQEPFPDARSYEALRQTHIESYDSLYAKPFHATISDKLFALVPPQLLLVFLATITLFALTYYHDSEIFILLFATSPIFITVFTTVGEAALGITLIAVLAALISKKQYWAVLLIPVCFSLGFSIGLLATITAISVALIYHTPFVALGASFFALVSALVVAVISPTFYAGIVIPDIPEFLGLFGGHTGITIFVLALGIIGFIVHYTKQKKAEQLVTLLIIPCALFFEYGAIIIAAFLALYASRAWQYLSTRKWEFEEVRTLTLLLITCGILFTTIVIERDRTAVDTERVALTEFVTATYPKGTAIAAPSNVAAVLAYKGYPSATPDIPSEPSFIASSLEEQGYSLIISDEKEPLYSHFPIAYTSGTYTVYTVPRY